MKQRVVARAVLAALTWAVGARASADYPPIVQQHLMTPPIQMIVGDAQGCLLCHLSESGGNGTNNAFGTLLRNNGAKGLDAASVIPALDKLAQSNPRAVADLQMGVNPNDDPMALGDDPLPKYGCGLSPAIPPKAVASWLSVAVLFAGGWRIRGRKMPAR